MGWKQGWTGLRGNLSSELNYSLFVFLLGFVSAVWCQSRPGGQAVQVRLSGDAGTFSAVAATQPVHRGRLP